MSFDDRIQVAFTIYGIDLASFYTYGNDDIGYTVVVSPNGDNEEYIQRAIDEMCSSYTYNIRFQQIRL